MATKLYITNRSPAYNPPTFRGSWNNTVGSIAGRLSPLIEEDLGFTSVGRTTAAINPYTSCNFRCVSPPINSAVNISGTVDAWCGGFHTNTGITVNTRLYVFVTVGDSDTIRGVLLDYTEPAGSVNWSASNLGGSYHLSSPQSVTPVAAQVGDRIVCELGLIARGSGTTSYTARGGTTLNGNLLPELSSTNSDGRFACPWIEISDTLDFKNSLILSQMPAEVIHDGVPNLRLSHIVAETIYTGSPKILLSQIVTEVIFSNRAPAEIGLSVTSEIAVTPQIVKASTLNKSLFVNPIIASDPQISGLGDISRNASTTLNVSQDITIRNVPIQNVISTVTVTPSIALIDAGPHLFVSVNVAVTSAIKFGNSINRQTVTTIVPVTSSYHESPKQLSVISTARVFSVILPSLQIFKTVISNVNATTSFGQKGPINAPTIFSFVNVGQGASLITTAPRITVTTNVTANSSATATIPQKRASLETQVAVTQAIRDVGNREITVDHVPIVQSIVNERNQNPRLFVFTVANAIQQIEQRSDVIRRSASNNVHVSSIIPTPSNTVVRISVKSNINAQQTITPRNSVVRIGVITSCNIATPESARNTGVRDSLTNNCTATDLANGEQFPPRKNILDTVTILDSISDRKTVYRISQNDAILIQSIAGFETPNVSFSNTVSVQQIVFCRSTNPNIEIKQLLTADQIIDLHNTNTRIEVISIVKNTQNSKNPIVAWSNINRMRVPNFIIVDSAITGGNSRREITYNELVTVLQIPRNNEIYVSVMDDLPISVSTDIQGGPNPRLINVETPVIVESIIAPLNNSIRQSVKDAILVTHKIYGQGPLVVNRLTSDVLVTQTINFTIQRLVSQSLSDNISIAQIIHDWGSPNRRLMIHNILMNQLIQARNTNVRCEVISNIAVATNLRLAEITVHHRIEAFQAINRVNNRLISQSFDMTQTIEKSTIFIRDVTQSLGMVDTLDRTIDYIRSINQTLDMPDEYWRKIIDFNGEPIMVPVVIGVKVEKFVTIKTQNQTILLPPPEFDDSEANVSSIDIKRAITGAYYVHVKSTDREKLNWPFKLSLDKALELRQFMLTAISQVITVTDWKGNIWKGYFVSNPFEFAADTRYANKRERISVTLEFEAVKLT